MRATFQSTIDRLPQVEKDNVELAANFAELEALRTLVRQIEARLPADRAGIVELTKPADPSNEYGIVG